MSHIELSRPVLLVPAILHIRYSTSNIFGRLIIVHPVTRSIGGGSLPIYTLIHSDLVLLVAPVILESSYA